MKHFHDLPVEIGSLMLKWEKFTEGLWYVARIFRETDGSHFMVLRNPDKSYQLILRSTSGIFNGLVVSDRVRIKLNPDAKSLPKICGALVYNSYWFDSFSLELA